MKILVVSETSVEMKEIFNLNVLAIIVILEKKKLLQQFYLKN